MSIKKLSMKDARDNDSKTLFFVFITWLVMLFKYVVAGVTYNGITFPEIDVMHFGIAVTGVLGIWVAREYKDKSMVIKKDA